MGEEKSQCGQKCCSVSKLLSSAFGVQRMTQVLRAVLFQGKGGFFCAQNQRRILREALREKTLSTHAPPLLEISSSATPKSTIFECVPQPPPPPSTTRSKVYYLPCGDLCTPAPTGSPLPPVPSEEYVGCFKDTGDDRIFTLQSSSESMAASVRYRRSTPLNVSGLNSHARRASCHR